MSEATEHREPFLGAFLLRLGIALVVTGGLITAILTWNQASATSVSGSLSGRDGSTSETHLALAGSDELGGAELTDVQVVESAKAPATRPEPQAEEPSTTEASIAEEPPKLAAAAEGSEMALSPVEAESEDLGSAIEPGEREEPAEESEGFQLPVGIGVSVGGFSGGTITIGGGAGGPFSTGGGGLGSFGRSGIGIITGGGSGCQGTNAVPISGPIADGSGPLSEGPVPVPGGSSTPRVNPTLPSVPNTLGLPVEPTTFGPGADRSGRREAGAEGRFLPSDLGRTGRNLVTEATSGFSGTGRSPVIQTSGAVPSSNPDVANASTFERVRQAGVEATRQAASTRQQAQPSMRQRVQQALRPQVQRAQPAARPQAQRAQRAKQPQARRVQQATRRAQQAAKPQTVRVQQRVQKAARPAATRRENRATARPAVQRTQRAQASRSQPAQRSGSQGRGLATRPSGN
jgi:hypothetical protein